MYPSTRPARCVHSCPHLSACSLAMLHVLDVFGSTRYSVSRSANNDILSMAMDNFIMNLTWHGDGVARFRRYQVEWPVMSGVTVMFWQAEVPKFTLKGGNPGRSAYSQIWLYIVIVWGRECLLFNYCILNMYIYIYIITPLNNASLLGGIVKGCIVTKKNTSDIHSNNRTCSCTWLDTHTHILSITSTIYTIIINQLS